ncbi:hypothetical protein CXF43_00005, partial [Corynebacterium bovis]|uniref:hypothetical protein n=1 Tax=Corynebacterium bovis TaxID=36808 RepID=UPI000FBFBADC
MTDPPVTPANAARAASRRSRVRSGWSRPSATAIHPSGAASGAGSGEAWCVAQGPVSGPYFVMEYVDGPNLATLISRRQEEGRPFTVDETVTLLRPVAAAL